MFFIVITINYLSFNLTEKTGTPHVRDSDRKFKYKLLMYNVFWNIIYRNTGNPIFLEHPV